MKQFVNECRLINFWTLCAYSSLLSTLPHVIPILILFILIVTTNFYTLPVNISRTHVTIIIIIIIIIIIVIIIVIIICAIGWKQINGKVIIGASAYSLGNLAITRAGGSILSGML